MTVYSPVHENIKPEKLYKFHGVLWQPVHSITHTTGHISDSVEATPYCPKCMAQLSSRASNEAYCDLCEISYPINPSIDQVAGLSHKAYNAKLKENWKVENLELPPDTIKGRDENDGYWVEVKLGQKNGKLMAVIYFGDKSKKNDGKLAYSQVFFDLEDEQLRFDKANKNPLEIIAKLQAEFQNSSHTSEKKQ